MVALVEWLLFRRCLSLPTCAAFWTVSEPVVGVSAAVAALSLHVRFAAALTGDEAGPHVRHPVTDAPVQRAHWVAVTGCRGKTSGLEPTFGIASLPPQPGRFGASRRLARPDSPSQMLGSLMSLSGCW